MTTLKTFHVMNMEDSNKILKLQPVEVTYDTSIATTNINGTTTDNQKFYELPLKQVENILPTIVQYNPVSKEPESIDYQQLVILLLKMLQQHNELIDKAYVYIKLLHEKYLKLSLN